MLVLEKSSVIGLFLILASVMRFYPFSGIYLASTLLLLSACSISEPETQLNRGKELLGQGQYNQAISHLNQTINESPRAAEAYGRRAQAYFRLGRWNESLADATRAISLNPRFADAYAVRADTWIMLNQMTAALNDARKAVLLNPQSAWYNTSCGWALQCMKDNAQALEFFDKALKISPGDANALRGRATAYNAMEKWEEAQKDIDQAISKEPKNASGFLIRCKLNCDLGQWEKAVQDANAVTLIEPNNFQAYGYRAWAQSELANWELAVQDYTTAIDLTKNANIAEFYIGRASALTFLGKYKDALQDCLLAKQINPSLVAPYQISSECYLQLGQGDNAITSATTAIRLDPTPVNYNNRGSIYKALNKMDLSIKDHFAAGLIKPKDESKN